MISGVLKPLLSGRLQVQILPQVPLVAQNLRFSEDFVLFLFPLKNGVFFQLGKKTALILANEKMERFPVWIYLPCPRCYRPAWPVGAESTRLDRPAHDLLIKASSLSSTFAGRGASPGSTPRSHLPCNVLRFQCPSSCSWPTGLCGPIEGRRGPSHQWKHYYSGGLWVGLWECGKSYTNPLRHHSSPDSSLATWWLPPLIMRGETKIGGWLLIIIPLLMFLPLVDLSVNAKRPALNGC